MSLVDGEQVTLADGASANVLAVALAEQVRSNLASPDKQADFEELAIAVGIVTGGPSLTLDFDHGRLVIYDGLRPGAGIVVHTDEARALRFAALPMFSLRRLPLLGDVSANLRRWVGPIALPNLMAGAGKELVRDLLSGALRIEGALSHPIATTRLLRLLAR